MIPVRVLVYGDSNSWGYLGDGTGRRHDRRWPVVAAERAGWDLVENCLPGRTTVHDDPVMAGHDPTGSAFNGLRHLETALLAASPIDLVLIMLGTNDFKARFLPEPERIASNLAELAETAQSVAAGPGAWDSQAPPRVGVILPPPLGALADNPDWEKAAEWTYGRAVSFQLPGAAKARFPKELVWFDAASTGITASDEDPIHLQAEAHKTLGEAVAIWVGNLGLTQSVQ